MQNSSNQPINGRIEARGLVKRYGDVTALDGLDLSVPEGTVLGLLGPNGAGKTTAVSILTTSLDPDEGEAVVAGADIRTHPTEVRRRIGLSGQYAAVDESLTGFENLEMIGRLYHLGRRPSSDRAHELLERFSLTEAGGRPVKGYSGGMRRRLDLAGALVAEPPVLFLDEPTTGLDPRSRNELWAVVDELVERGRTVLLTTQYMEEADMLADDIVVMDQGRRIAQGSADQLKAMVGGERIEISLAYENELGDARRIVERFAEEPPRISNRTVTAAVVGGSAKLTLALRALDDARVTVTDVGLRRPTLDDVFLSLTGRETNADRSAPDTDHSPASERVLEGVA